MTNEIAIHRLLLVRHRKDCTELLAEALDMAIEALSNSQNQTDSEVRTSADDVSEADVIYRQDAIDVIKDVCDAIMSGCESWYDPEIEDEIYKDIREVDAILKCNKEIRIALRNLPSAQRTGEWEEIEVIADAYDINGVKTWASKMKCDQCGFTTIAIEGHFSQYNFCPNCGSHNGSEL